MAAPSKRSVCFSEWKTPSRGRSSRPSMRSARVRSSACRSKLSYLRDSEQFDYALIVDRISHEVTFYRTFLKGRGRARRASDQQPVLVVGGRQILRHRRGRIGRRGGAQDGARAAQAPAAQHRGRQFQELAFRRLERGIRVPRLSDLPQTRLRRRLEGRLQVRRSAAVLRRLRSHARPDDDGPRGDRPSPNIFAATCSGASACT